MLHLANNQNKEKGINLAILDYLSKKGVESNLLNQVYKEVRSKIIT